MSDTPRPRPASAPPRPLRVLVVEDDPDAREYLGQLIELWGHQAFCAEAGTPAIEAARRRLPDLALIDLGLPGLDGHAVARAIRALEGRPGNEGRAVYLVALTGHGQSDDRRQSRLAGFDEHLVKPIDPSSIRTLLSSAGALRASAHLPSS